MGEWFNLIYVAIIKKIWQRDTGAEANRIPVEEVKPANEQGKLLNTVDQKHMKVKERSVAIPKMAAEKSVNFL